MSTGAESKSTPPDSRAPRAGLQMMALILVAMALLAIYSYIQKSHLDQIEKVMIEDEPAAQSSPAISPTPTPR